jgi:hypothetical protein
MRRRARKVSLAKKTSAHRDSDAFLRGQMPAASVSLLFGAATAETFVETIDSTASVNDLLLAGIERMALRTDIDMKVFTAC